MFLLVILSITLSVSTKRDPISEETIGQAEKISLKSSWIIFGMTDRFCRILYNDSTDNYTGFSYQLLVNS